MSYKAIYVCIRDVTTNKRHVQTFKYESAFKRPCRCSIEDFRSIKGMLHNKEIPRNIQNIAFDVIKHMP